MKKKLAAIGELLIDFTPAGVSAKGGALFEKNPGGAPANLTVQAARLGVDAAFIGNVGNDAFGLFLKQTLNDCGVDTRGLVLDDENLTTLAFVELSDKGDRTFSFYRKPGADTCLRFGRVNKDVIDECDLLQFGSLSCTDEPARDATYRAVDYAKSLGKIISYDPNWRKPLWKDERSACQQMQKGAALCDILKVSAEELGMISGTDDINAGVAAMLSQGIAVVAVTLGPDGAMIANAQGILHCPTYDTKVVDTTGSGDSFFGALLACLLQGEKQPREYTLQELYAFTQFANAAGSLCACSAGGIPSLPYREAIERCMRETPLLRL